MAMNEFKRELSKLSGIDFFNPKFRDVFKKYFPEDKEEDVNLEEERAEELGLIENNANEQTDNTEMQEAQEDKETNSIETEDNNVDEAKEEIEEVQDEIEEEKSSQNNENEVSTQEPTPETDNAVDEKIEQEKIEEELLDAKIELELVKGGIREDKLRPAMRLAKFEIHHLDELDRVQDILADYPEWIKNYKSQDFGMAVNEKDDGLTEEEKRLKQMGIDPR